MNIDDKYQPQAFLPLVVDLDGTIIKTDLLFESLNQIFTRHPLHVIKVFGWLFKGKSFLKARLAEICSIDVSVLPYNQVVIDWLLEQRKLGRRLILATASHKILADSLANYLGVFHEVYATTENTNLKSKEKRDFLVSKFGSKGFDYIGNDASDFYVWHTANAAIVVSSSPDFIDRVNLTSNLVKTFPSGRPPYIRTLFSALRPHQWLKNLLIFIPLLSAHHFIYSDSNLQAILAFAVFSLTASSVYILNDLIDIEDDRHHKTKCRRVFASGDVSLIAGWISWSLLLIISFGVAWIALTPTFITVLAIYFVLTAAYSLFLKKIPIIDVIILAGLYTLRIIAGAMAISVPLSFWLLTFSMFIFLSLAFIKRYSELLSARMAALNKPLRGRGYEPQDLQIVSTMGIASGYSSVLVLALYIQDDHTIALYQTPYFIWLACPLLLFWISRAWLIAHRGKMNQDPIVFAIKDSISWVISVCFLGVFILALFF